MLNRYYMGRELSTAMTKVVGKRYQAGVWRTDGPCGNVSRGRKLGDEQEADCQSAAGFHPAPQGFLESQASLRSSDAEESY